MPTAANIRQATDANGVLYAVGGDSTDQANQAFTPTCSVHGDDVEGDGDEQGDDGHKGHFHFCKGSGDMDYDEPDSGKGMRGSMDAVTISGNQAIISGAGTLLDGTPVRYNAVVLGNPPVMGVNNFAISWTGSASDPPAEVLHGNSGLGLFQHPDDLLFMALRLSRSYTRRS